MQIQVLLFGITRDIVGQNQLKISMDEEATTDELKELLHQKYPKLASYKYALAVNETYANEILRLNENDTVALIPPVSGG